MDFSTHEIGGVGLEQYAKLCALMANTKPEDTDKHAEIAAANGVSKENWEEAKEGWTKMMSDPAHAMAIQQIFMPTYQKALEEASGGEEPCPLDLYAKMKAAMAYEKDPDNPDQKIPFEKVIEREGFDVSKWGTVESYWMPRVNKDEHGRLQEGKFDEEQAKEFRVLMQKYADEIMGIER